MMSDAKTARPAPRRRRRLHRRGTAMIEFVLVVPFLAMILALTFFFGWATLHKHQVVVADRYAAWRRIEAGSWPTEDDLNRLMFMDRAEDVNLSGSSSDLRATAIDLAGQTASQHELAGSLADELVVNRFPAGRRAHVAAKFHSNQAMWDRFSGYIRHQHGREGITWRRDEVNCWSTLRDQYYAQFDRDMRSIPAPARGMASMIRRLYLKHW